MEKEKTIEMILQEALYKRQRVERIERIGKNVLAIAFVVLAVTTVLTIGHPLLIALLGSN